MANKKKERARTARRRAERAAEKLARDRRKLQALEPGGSPDNPIEVKSASLIDPKARDLRCARCDRTMDIVDERSGVREGRVARAVELRCRHCGELRTAHFAVVAPLPS